MIFKILLSYATVAYLLSSCSNQITGLYYNEDYNKNSPGSSYISICKDSVTYFVHNDILGSSEYKGTWLRYNDTLIFNIKKPCQGKESLLIENINDSSDFIHFDISLLRPCGDTSNMIGDTIIINDTMRIPIEKNNVVKIDKISIKKIEVRGIFDRFYKQKLFYPKNHQSNNYSIFVGESDDEQTIMLYHSKFLIRKNKLLAINISSDSVKISDFEYKRHGKCIK